jgi:outer membrane protease
LNTRTSRIKTNVFFDFTFRRLTCPAGVASTYDAKTKKDTCDYRDDVVVEKVNVTVTIGKDGAVEFDDDST